MFEFFSEMRNKKHFRDNLKRICHSIDFDNSYDHLPTLEFEYLMEGNSIKITGPINSLYNIEKYEITFDNFSQTVFFNKVILNPSQFKFFYNTIFSVYGKLIKREEFIKIIRKHREDASKIPLNRHFNNSSSDSNNSRKKSHSSSSSSRSESRSTRNDDD